MHQQEFGHILYLRLQCICSSGSQCILEMFTHREDYSLQIAYVQKIINFTLQFTDSFDKFVHIECQIIHVQAYGMPLMYYSGAPWFPFWLNIGFSHPSIHPKVSTRCIQNKYCLYGRLLNSFVEQPIFKLILQASLYFLLVMWPKSFFLTKQQKKSLARLFWASSS